MSTMKLASIDGPKPEEREWSYQAAIGRPQEILRGYLANADTSDYDPASFVLWSADRPDDDNRHGRDIVSEWITYEAERRSVPVDELIAVVWRSAGFQLPGIRVPSAMHFAPNMGKWSHYGPTSVWRVVGTPVEVNGFPNHLLEQYFLDKLMQVYVMCRTRRIEERLPSEAFARLCKPARFSPEKTQETDLLKFIE